MIDAPTRNPIEQRALWGVFSLLLGSKLLTLAIAASPAPFTDEWDADGAGLLKPWLEGHADWRMWLHHDNEHLIFFTRPLTVLAYQISGYWDVVLPMIVNGVLHAALLTLLLAALTRPLPTAQRLPALLLGGGFALLPFGNENTLLGFNSHFYLLIGAALLALKFFAVAPAWSKQWFFGVAAAICAFLSLASGALVPLAGAALGLAQILASNRAPDAAARRREISGLIALVSLSAAMIALTPHIPGNDVYRAENLSAFIAGCVNLLSWPAHGPIGLILILPGLWFAARLWSEKPGFDDPRWLHLGIMIWILGQYAALSYGRGGVLVSRYLDFCVIGVLANAMALFQLLPWRGFERPAYRRKFAGVVAGLLVFTLFINHGRVSKLNNIFQRRDEAAAQTLHLRAYLASGAAEALQAENKYDLPYPDRNRLKMLLDDPTLRAILPPTLDPAQPTRPAVETLKSAAIASWPLWFALGLGLWLAALYARPARDGRTSRLDRRPAPTATHKKQDQTVMIQV